MNRLDHPMKIINENTDVLRAALRVAKRKRYADGGDVQDNDTPPQRGVVDKLLGLTGERYQTWPEKMVRGLASLPQETIQSAQQPRLLTEDDPTGYSPMIGASLNVAQNMIGAGTAFTPMRALGTAGSKMIQPAKEYPIAPRGEWYGEANFENNGGVMRQMSPDEFLRKSRPLDIDEVSRENIDLLKQHIQEGKTLDPLNLYAGGKEDGRHRAIAAKELGIQSVPVIDFRPSPADPFYSQVGRTIENSPQAKASPDQWTGWLKNQPGVKQEELEWMGLPDYLKQQQGPVTKEALQDFVKQNQVQLKEVTKGAGVDEAFTVSSAGGPAASIPEVQRFPSREAAQAELTRRETELPNAYHGMAELPSQGSITKFGSYQLPGGSDYREMLLTLPPKFEGGVGLTTNDIAKRLGYSGWHSSLTPEQAANVERAFSSQKMGPTEFNNRMEAIQEEMRRMASGPNRDPVTNKIKDEPRWHALANERDALQAQHDATSKDHYKSSHWDEPNVLAHVRFNDRTIDGKKTLFLEEIQSDWHQQGKRRGYGTPEPYEVYSQDTNEILSRHKTMDEADEAASRLRDAGTPRVDSRLGTARDAVPDAPFKRTEDWAALALKRMIRHAAENGYEKIAWTDGATQAARYDLSKQVKSIDVHPRTDAVTGERDHSVLISLPDGHAMSLGVNKQGIVDNVGASNPEMKGKRLDEIVGKDIADKILKTEGATKLSGVDLKVGGEGMKGFYDKILPSVANKLGKKYGAKAELGGLQTQIKVMRAGPEDWRVINNEGRGLVEASGEPMSFTSEAAAKAHAKNESTHVHTMNLTPAMIKAAMGEGFPLFQKGGRVKEDSYKRFRDSIKILRH